MVYIFKKVTENNCNNITEKVCYNITFGDKWFKVRVYTPYQKSRNISSSKAQR